MSRENVRADLAYVLLAECATILEPLAEEASHYDPDEGDGPNVAWDTNFTIAYCRAARDLLSRLRAAQAGR